MSVNSIFLMARTMSALSTKTAQTSRRGTVSQHEAGGRSVGVQGETEGAKTRRGEEEEAGEESKEDEEEHKDNKHSKSSNEESEETPMKPPVKAHIASKTQAKTNTDEGMEGMADNKELFPRKVDVLHKVFKSCERPTEGSRAETCVGQSTSERARAAGTLVPCRQESVRHCMLWHLELWLPGCLFPWA